MYVSQWWLVLHLTSWWKSLWIGWIVSVFLFFSWYWIQVVEIIQESQAITNICTYMHIYKPYQHTYAHTYKYHLGNRILCVSTYVYVDVHMFLYICIIESYQDDVLPIQTLSCVSRPFIPFLQAKSFLSFLSLQRSSESDFIWETAFLILCWVRSTLTYGSTKAQRLGHPVLVVLLLRPVFIRSSRGRLLASECACYSWLHVILTRHGPDTIIQMEFSTGTTKIHRTDSLGSSLLCGCNQICRTRNNHSLELFQIAVVGHWSQKLWENPLIFFFVWLFINEQFTEVLAVKMWNGL